MLLARSTMWIQRQYNEYYLQPAQKTLKIQNMEHGQVRRGLMDGAGDGAQKVTYTFDKWFDAIRNEPKGILLSSHLSRPMFVGLEMKGIAGDPVWQRSNRTKIRNNPSNSYLSRGSEREEYSVGRSRVSIRSAGSTMTIKSLSPCELMDIYFKSVGRGTLLLLNIPPNQEAGNLRMPM